MTGLRLGVDVGGTFTKAVAVDPTSSEVVARAMAPTTRGGPDGVSGGVVAVIHELAREVGPGRVGLVTHSTTQAVNAMLEGDAAPVGILGMGRAPDVRKARKRTAVAGAAREFLDVTAGLDRRGPPCTARAAGRRGAHGVRGRGVRP
jgi:N-methylhydantoinase A/oxoprolinase/acetone carboxylase beta subunit